jgi:hypothetical protein
MTLSGTSMAAPHVAAMAARYGTPATSPADRESYIRSRLFTTGQTDQAGAPIRVPSIAQSTANTTHLTNISTRANVDTGDGVMITGITIEGATNKTVAIVVAGPSLGAYGIPNPLANPTVTLVRNGAVVAANDNWGDAPNAAQIQASGYAPSHPLESAILINLAPGAYTAIVSGVGGGTGIGIVAAYEVDHPETPFTNISTRAFVRTGNDVAIAGFAIQGNAPQTVVVHGIGPSLAAAGIANPLANPTLTLVRSADNAVMATNDDWGASAYAAELQASGFAPSNSLESAIKVTLAPGSYTVILSGVGGGTGIGIVAVYPQ